MSNVPTRLAILLALVAACLIAGGCGNPLDSYFPLAVGNEWQYKTTYSASGTTTEHTDRIVGRKGATYRFADDHKLIRFNVSIAEDIGVDLIRLPTRKGTHWQTEGVQAEITSDDKTVTVPAGTFERCLEVSWKSVIDDKPRLSITTYAPGVGPVLVEFYTVAESGENTPLMRSELTRFSTK